MTSKQEVLEWAGKQKYIDFLRIKPVPHWEYAKVYLETYEGEADFLLSVRRQLDSGSSLSAKQVAAVLNFARREAKADGAVKKVTVLQLATQETDTLKEEIAVAEIQKDEIAEFVDALPQEFLTEDLKQLAGQIAELEKSLKDFKSQGLLGQIESDLKRNTHTEKELRDELKLRLEELEQERTSLQTIYNEANQHLLDLTNELNKAKLSYQDSLKLVAAQQKLDIMRKELDSLRELWSWKDKVLPYQWDDVCYLIGAFRTGKPGVLNANEMGLGKTAEFAFFYSLFRHYFYAEHGRFPLSVYATKKSLVGSTFKELKKWFSADEIQQMPIIKLDGSAPVAQREMILEYAIVLNALVVVNYDAFATTPLLRKTKWDLYAADEVHKLRGGANPAGPTQIFTNAKEAANNSEFKVLLSGSPIQNNPREMWCYLNIFDEERFPDPKSFMSEYCFGWGQKDSDGNPILNVSWDKLIDRALKNKVIRRTKKEVRPDLPDKIYDIREIEMGDGCQGQTMQMMRDFLFVWLDKNAGKAISGKCILDKINKMRQINVLPASMNYYDEDLEKKVKFDCWESCKLDEALELTEELVGSGEQVIIVSSQFNDPIFELKRRIREFFPSVRVATITGKDTQKGTTGEKERAFQQGEIDVLVVNAMTAGEGLNLQKFPDEWPGGASHMIFLDQWWNPESNHQMEDRIWRHPYADVPEYHILRTVGTVDYFVLEKIEMKNDMIHGIMDRNELRNGGEWKNFLEGLI